MVGKPQRIRDPIHNLIEFDAKPFEQMCWSIIETREFQRLRRIKQLGFSDFVYPSASHSRYAHSIGVFHTARELNGVIEKIRPQGHNGLRGRVAIAAALVHDLGHGPFSHAFEDVMKEFSNSKHEATSVRIIKETAVGELLNKFHPGFAQDVGEIIGNKVPADIYASIVSSQFDADRLDYMQRDRFMTGAQSSAIDFEWLLANLNVGVVKLTQDDTVVKDVETLVVGYKALTAVEAYVMGLFHLYPNVYYHKSTRAAEKMTSELLLRLFKQIKEGGFTTLQKQHPLVKFALDTDSIVKFIALDDTVIWGALEVLKGSTDRSIADLSMRLLSRKLYKAIDVTAEVDASCNTIDSDKERGETQKRRLAAVRDKIENSGLLKNIEPVALSDNVDRDPYRKNQGDEAALDRVYAIDRGGQLRNLSDISPVVASLRTYQAYRIYFRDGDDNIKNKVDAIIKEGCLV
jgi:uncharacterized protein